MRQAHFFSVLLAHFIYQNDRLSYNKNARLYSGLCGRHGGERQQRPRISALICREKARGAGGACLSAATLYGKRLSQTVDPMVMTGYHYWGLGVWYWSLAVTFLAAR